jgi:hypothetical protein
MPLLLSTIISCNQLYYILDRIVKNTTVTERQRYEIVVELRKHISTCPLQIKKQTNSKK